MWNNDKYILWQHIVQEWNEDHNNRLKLLPKITSDHINLTPYSTMTVRYAAQVLSNTMATVLKQFGQPDVQETAKFCDMMDGFFDCLNVRSPNESQRKLKPNLRPYVEVNDQRFEWLEKKFLGYLEEWRNNIKNRPGNSTAMARSTMFLSHQTYEGLQITTFAMIEAVKFLLAERMPYVLTERFCQDSVENYFGVQRSLYRRSDNPDLKQFGYNNNTIQIQRNVSHTSGNTRGRFDKKRAWESISNDKIPKRHTKKQAQEI